MKDLINSHAGAAAGSPQADSVNNEEEDGLASLDLQRLASLGWEEGEGFINEELLLSSQLMEDSEEEEDDGDEADGEQVQTQPRQQQQPSSSFAHPIVSTSTSAAHPHPSFASQAQPANTFLSPQPPVTSNAVQPHPMASTGAAPLLPAAPSLSFSPMLATSEQQQQEHLRQQMQPHTGTPNGTQAAASSSRGTARTAATGGPRASTTLPTSFNSSMLEGGRAGVPMDWMAAEGGPGPMQQPQHGMSALLLGEETMMGIAQAASDMASALEHAAQQQGQGHAPQFQLTQQPTHQPLPQQLDLQQLQAGGEEQQQQQQQMHLYTGNEGQQLQPIFFQDLYQGLQPGELLGRQQLQQQQQQPTYRTRARCDLRDVPIEELEMALLEDWVEDAEAAAAVPGELTEYEKFLRSLRNVEDGGAGAVIMGEYNEDDDDDEEFVLSYQEMFGLGFPDAWDGQGTTSKRGTRNNVWGGPRRVLPDRQARARAREVLRAAAQAANAVAPQGLMGASEVRQVYWQMHMHTQLLMQQHLLLAKDPSQKAQDLAQHARSSLQQLEDARVQSSLRRQDAGWAPFPPEMLGMQQHPPLPPPSQQQQQQQQQQRRQREQELEQQQQQPLALPLPSQQEQQQQQQLLEADLQGGRFQAELITTAGRQSGTESGQRPSPAPPTTTAGVVAAAAKSVRAARVAAESAHEEGVGDPAEPGWVQKPADDTWQPLLLQDAMSALDVPPLRFLPAYDAAVEEVPILERSGVQELADLESSNAKERKKIFRRGKWTHPFVSHWDKVVQPILDSVLPQGTMDPLLYYNSAPTMPRHYWSPGEDQLLAAGIARFGTDWSAIATAYLPTRTPQQVFVRQKNLIARRKASSCVPQAKAAVIEGPLTADEKAKIIEGLSTLSGTSAHGDYLGTGEGGSLPWYLTPSSGFVPGGPKAAAAAAAALAGHAMIPGVDQQVEEATAQSLASAAGLWQALSDEWLPHRRPEVLARLWQETLKHDKENAHHIAPLQLQGLPHTHHLHFQQQQQRPQQLSQHRQQDQPSLLSLIMGMNNSPNPEAGMGASGAGLNASVPTDQPQPQSLQFGEADWAAAAAAAEMVVSGFCQPGIQQQQGPQQQQQPPQQQQELQHQQHPHVPQQHPQYPQQQRPQQEQYPMQHQELDQSHPQEAAPAGAQQLQHVQHERHAAQPQSPPAPTQPSPASVAAERAGMTDCAARSVPSHPPALSPAHAAAVLQMNTVCSIRESLASHMQEIRRLQAAFREAATATQRKRAAAKRAAQQREMIQQEEEEVEQVHGQESVLDADLQALLLEDNPEAGAGQRPRKQQRRSSKGGGRLRGSKAAGAGKSGAQEGGDLVGFEQAAEGVVRGKRGSRKKRGAAAAAAGGEALLQGPGGSTFISDMLLQLGQSGGFGEAPEDMSVQLGHCSRCL